MSEFQSLEVPQLPMELQETTSGHEIRAATYTLHFRKDIPYIELSDKSGSRWIDISTGSDVTTSSHPDVAYETKLSSITRDSNTIEVRLQSQTDESIPKFQVWKCHEDFIETYIESTATDGLKFVRFLGGTMVETNSFGTYMSQRYFNSVYNPQPSEMERPVIPAVESTEVTTSGMWKPGRRREFLMTPFSFGFNMSDAKEAERQQPGNWLMASISAPIEEQTMIAYRYEAHEDGFSLVLDYDMADITETRFRSPSLLIHFAETPHAGLRDLTDYSTQLGHLSRSQNHITPDWYRGSTLVSWGSQLERKDTLQAQGVDVQARDLATESFVTEGIRRLEEYGIDIDKLVIDDKWQHFYGTNMPDVAKWPDMNRFIATQHEVGRRVLLWIKLFDPEGLPPNLCIVDAHGRPVASDPTNPDYLECVREQIKTLLSSEMYDADGLKLDFLAQLPHGPGLYWHGKKRGHAALYDLLATIYDAASHAKTDALIQTHIISPWFADVMNQVRLNDSNEHRPIIETMGRRAALTASLLPNHSIDPDGWPMLDKSSWTTYMSAQPEIAHTVTTHFFESVRGEKLTPDDYARLAAAVHRAKTLMTG